MADLTPNPAAVVDVDTLRAMLDALHALWKRDPEMGHYYADEIRVRVLELVAAGHPAASVLAREVLVMETWDVTVWHA
ncbi:hypothetical protein [Actinomadura yumaensis]|uniref:Uncharacterized protein n=1 Tax=Actinomadura yumaensis TaxID=111807 RepID=A0ABW2CSY1_9ACTN